MGLLLARSNSYGGVLIMPVMFLYNAPEDSLPVVMTNVISKQNTDGFFKIIHKIIEIAHENNYARGNLWHNYLTYFILSNENVFSLSCERREAPENSLKKLVLHDLGIFMQLFSLSDKIASFDCIKNFDGDNASSLIVNFSAKLANAKTSEEFYGHVCEFYKNFGSGIFAFNKAFRLSGNSLIPVPDKNIGSVNFEDIIGYEIQKKELISNTESFLSGKPANNVLLYGDGGTGKSTSIKALLNEYFALGLRVVEIYKHQFRDILRVTEVLRKRNYKFIIFIDDLSFEENEIEYKYLKAVIEGGIETKPDNVLIYATSNRRHIIRETWNDRNDMEHNGDIHRSDTVEEKLSLASRFGIAINYSIPTREEYHEIVLKLAEKSGLSLDRDELLKAADTWELRHGGMSGRTARQFVDYRLGREDLHCI